MKNPDVIFLVVIFFISGYLVGRDTWKPKEETFNKYPEIQNAEIKPDPRYHRVDEKMEELIRLRYVSKCKNLLVDLKETGKHHLKGFYVIGQDLYEMETSEGYRIRFWEKDLVGVKCE